VTYDLIIPKGVDNGRVLRVKKIGNQTKNKRFGDLVIKLKVMPHEFFKRQGKDIHTDRNISISQAVLGGTIEISTLYGKKKIYISPGTESGSTNKILGFGVENAGSKEVNKGNHYIHLKFKYQKHLIKNRKWQWKNIPILKTQFLL